MIMNEEYFNAENMKYLTIPKYETDLDAPLPVDPKSESVYFYVLPETEYLELEEMGAIDVINSQLEYNIEPFEDERISARDCGKCLEILQHFGVKNTSVLYQAFARALDCGTFIELYF